MEMDHYGIHKKIENRMPSGSIPVFVVCGYI